MREIRGLDKSLMRITGELKNNAKKLSEIDEHLKKEYAKLAEIRDDPSEYSDNLRDKIKHRINELKEERLVRLEILSQILDGDFSLREKNQTCV